MSGLKMPTSLECRTALHRPLRVGDGKTSHPVQPSELVVHGHQIVNASPGHHEHLGGDVTRHLWAHPATCVSDHVAVETLKTRGKQPASIVPNWDACLRAIRTQTPVRSHTLIVSGVARCVAETSLLFTTTPEERSNENTNGLLRQYFPKDTDMSQLTQADLDFAAHQLNGRPRQTLGWTTPSDKLAETMQ